MTKNIILCGMPGVGKSTIGRQVAEKLKWDFLDTDLLIVEQYSIQTGMKLSCREITWKEGETTFRQLEHQAIASLISHQNQVIALGGGVVLREDNVALLKTIGLLVYVTDEKEKIKQQLFQNGIPAYIDKSNPLDSFEKLFEYRTKIYENIAQHTIDKAHMRHEEVIFQICNLRQTHE